ncbi:hypothetical protein MTR_7g045690 [Medicago truncatula]|uniref:Reverse transcriptase zinc-binding domain-containing protein n=1 Tax=Medicago truncatula TaxID=3880 RepID=G7KU22_MEDTR|nr:hypothetical protein MTR_7g045690 [Medicago truncatula]
MTHQRICRECVPTHLRLQSRHVQCEMICPWCDTTVEDDLHAFMGCTVAHESWYWVGISTVLHLRIGTMNIAGRVTLLLWQIWAARNDVIWNDACHTSMNIGRTALDAWHQWQEVPKHHSPPVVQHGHNRVQACKKPNDTWLTKRYVVEVQCGRIVP